MIFVYPSVISENVPDHMYPAIAKTLEQFYLLQILQSFGSGNLRVKSVYNIRKKIYGPLVLEHKNNDSKTLMMEAMRVIPLVVTDNAKDIDPILAKQLIDEISDKFIPYPKVIDKNIPANGAPESELLNWKSILVADETQCNVYMRQITAFLTATKIVEGDFNAKPDISALKEIRRFITDLKIILDTLEMRRNTDRGELNTVERALKNQNSSDDSFKANKEKREQDKADEEKKREKASQSQVRGSYQISDTEGTSLQPTMATIKVKIHYIGGPGEGYGDSKNIDVEEVAIGTKVIPCRIQNFQKIQDAILDDYFTNRVEMWFKIISRKSVRGIFRFVERSIKKIAGIDVDVAAMIKDPVKRMILLSPQGFVNAGSFKHNRNSPSFYNFSSASVIFRDDDMTYDGGENFFNDKSQLNKMFKAGWNTFVVMKEIDEKIYFISSLDGGLLHILPYSYMFNALKMDKVYDSDEFKRKSKGFQMRSGNVSTLANKLSRESGLFESVKKAMYK